MKVRLRNQLPQSRAAALVGWLKPDKEYVVLEIENNGCMEYRIESEDSGQPVLFEIELFDIVDATHPRTWVESSVAGEFSPAAWQVPGFWEDYFDGEPTARDSYRCERDQIYRESFCVGS